MKRFLTVLLSTIIFTFPLSACGEPPKVNSDLTAAFTTEYLGADYSGTLNKNGDHMTITMNAPNTARGLVFDYRGDTLSINLGVHSTEADTEYLPYNCIPSVLHNSLAYLPQAAYSGTEDGSDIFALPTPYGNATLTAQNGVPLSLTDPHSGMEFTFSQDQ